MKVIDLKEKLQEILEELECYEDSREIKLKTNTYFCHGNFLSTYQGFVDFNDLVEEEDEEDGDSDEY